MSCAELCCITDLLLLILLYLNEICDKVNSQKVIVFFASTKESMAEVGCFAVVCANVVC